jgi:RNA polymerase sigma-70 factor, ECF subfamily
MTDSPSTGHKEGTGLALPAERVGERAGSPAAPRAELRFEEIFRSYFDFVWGGLRRMGVPAASVDDAVQDVFLVVHRRQQDFEGRSSLKTWLYGIVLRVAHDHRRSLARAGGEGQPLPPALADGRPGPQEAAARSEALRLLARLLGELDEEKRDVFVLADLEQLSAKEIAEIVGTNVNTVYSRLRAARRQFNEAVARSRREQR